MSLEPSPPLCQKHIDGTIATEFEKDRECFLFRFNEHLEMLLKKANRDIKLQRHMSRHYYIRKWIKKSHSKVFFKTTLCFRLCFWSSFSKEVSDQMKMNFGKPKDFFSKYIPNHNKLLHVLHRYHILGDIQLSWRPISENQILQFNFLFLVIILKIYF